MNDSDSQIRAYFREQSRQAGSEALRRLYGFLGLEPLVLPEPAGGADAPHWCSQDDPWLSRSKLALAQAKSTLQAKLPDPPDRFLLGRYIEMLAKWLCEELLNAEVIAHNLAIRDPQAIEPRRTIGELDLVYRFPEDKRVRHRELAAKWYLYDPSNPPESSMPWASQWWGPQRRDRLDLKLDRMLNHQIALSQHPATKALLGGHSPHMSELWMNGQLFWPLERALPSEPASLRPQVNRVAIAGRWARYSQWCEYAKQKKHVGPWVLLPKSQWLSPRHSGARIEPLGPELGAPWPHPQLLALAPAEQCERSLDWLERERVFVVPDDWGETRC